MMKASQLGVLPAERAEPGPEIVVGDVRGHLPHPRLASAALELAPGPHVAEADEASHGHHSEHRHAQAHEPAALFVGMASAALRVALGPPRYLLLLARRINCR